ncbi:histidinol dehydrogenase [Capsulimonas corticalis]|uniref:Histidinol dehydrogenase n=1 Tax=Capsulimonas corticalis TaxID=2219043 RepID=A0A402D3A9_9BACT|nr:histidinol dehydrogenase [Capsulimonas corticalis]BDI28470.1 histidinol dehydrogenase [Capsulimonas corticalis]
MREFDTATISRAEIERKLTVRTDENTSTVEATVRDILHDVRTQGDAGLLAHTQRLHWPGATAETLLASQDERDAASDALDAQVAGSLRAAAANIDAFHRAERGQLQSWMHTESGGRVLGQLLQPVQRVGLYVPGGKAFYPSTVLMTAIPAVAAGVAEIILCTPAGADGSINPAIYAAAAPYVQKIFKIGGAQAIGAMAYGTETVPKVDVIVGPGNQYVNIAKRLVYGEVGIDMLAGPSEVAVIADADANPAFVAADILAQIEHSQDNRGFLFSPSQPLLDRVKAEVLRQAALLSRGEILAHTIEHLTVVKTRTLDEAIELSNILAPEHLELCVREPLAALPKIKNAGAVLLGEHTSAPIGDYIAGPSHTLPTAGAARFSSPLSVATFMKRTSVIYYSAEAARSAAPDVARIADVEGFDAHGAAALLRASTSPKEPS